MAGPTRLITVLAVLILVAGCTSDDSAAEEPTTTAAASTTTEATTTTAPTTTTTTTTTTTESASSVVDAVDLIVGTWLWEEVSAFTRFVEDGTWGVWFSARQVGNDYPHDWGTYTFDGETLVFYNAEGSYCPGAVASWTVEFSDDGQEARSTFVEDSCTAANLTRDQDQFWVRQTP